MIGAMFFILGLLTGSFLNSVIFRLREKTGFVKGHSKCPGCGKILSARELIPLISFVIQKGRCRGCQKRISIQYPLVELASGLLFLASYLYFGLEWRLLLTLIYISFLMILFVYDLKYYFIPDVVVLPAILIALIGQIVLGVSFTKIALGGIIGLGFFLIQYILSKGKWIGGGDLRLGLLMGVMLGWSNILVALFIAYVVGAVFALYLVVFKKKTWKEKIPLGTFLTFACVITIFFGEAIINWYWY